MGAALQLGIFDQFSTFDALNLSTRGLRAFFNNFEVSESGCWLWIGGIGQDGYGHVRSRDTNYSAARVAWLCWHGPIPAGYEPDHLCPWRNCICPEHLELITHLENMRRGRVRNLTRTHCWRGHELTPQNTRMSRGWRVCRLCKPEVKHATSKGGRPAEPNPTRSQPAARAPSPAQGERALAFDLKGGEP